MPIYEYRCQDCAKTFDLLTSYAERDRPHVCPNCESLQTRVQVSSFAAIGAGVEGAPEVGPAPSAGGGCCGGSCGCSCN